MEDQVATLRREIYEGISLFNQWSETLSNLLPVDYHSKIKWYGGLPGAIIEARESKRMEQMINTPIVGELSFWNLTFLIPEKVKELGEKTREIQTLLPNSEPSFNKIGDDLICAIYDVIRNWKKYSPAMAGTVFSFGKGRKNNKSLIQYVLEEVGTGLDSVRASEAAITMLHTQLPLMLLV